MTEPFTRRAAPRLDLTAAAGLARTLRLERPLVFFDLESTGLDPQADRIVEFAAIRLAPSGLVEMMETLVNPRIPVPAEASRVHGLDAPALADAPGFATIAPAVARFLDGADLAGYNVLRFDLEMLAAEMRRCGVPLDTASVRVVDPCVIFKLRERRDLHSAHVFYCGEPLEAAHRAAADALASLEVLAGQLRRYPDLPPEVDALDRLARRGPTPPAVADDGEG